MSNNIDKYFKLKQEQYEILKIIKLSNFDFEDNRNFYWMSDGINFRYAIASDLITNVGGTEIEETYNISGYIIFRRTTIDWILPDICCVFDPSKQVPWKE